MKNVTSSGSLSPFKGGLFKTNALHVYTWAGYDTALFPPTVLCAGSGKQSGVEASVPMIGSSERNTYSNPGNQVVGVEAASVPAVISNTEGNADPKSDHSQPQDQIVPS